MSVVSSLSQVPVALKRLLVGRPFRSDRLGETLLSKRIALPVFASDAMSSVAYAPQEIFLVLSVAGLTAYAYTPWVALAVAVGDRVGCPREEAIRVLSRRPLFQRAARALRALRSPDQRLGNYILDSLAVAVYNSFIAAGGRSMREKTTISTFQLFQMFPDQDSARKYLESRI